MQGLSKCTTSPDMQFALVAGIPTTATRQGPHATPTLEGWGLCLHVQSNLGPPLGELEAATNHRLVAFYGVCALRTNGDDTWHPCLPPRPEPKAEPVIGFLLPKPMAALAQVATEAALHLMSTNIRGSIILQVDTVLPGFVGPVVAFALAHRLCSCLLAMSAHTSAMGDIDHAAIESRPNLVHAESQGTGDQFASNVRANARWAEQCFGAAGAHIAGPLLRPCQPWHLPPLSLAGLGRSRMQKEKEALSAGVSCCELNMFY